MFVPIGLWRGALREWIALAGITFGSLLAAKWANPWGNDLAALSGMDPKLAHFTVAALFFLGTTLIVEDAEVRADPDAPEGIERSAGAAGVGDYRLATFTNADPAILWSSVWPTLACHMPSCARDSLREWFVP